MTFISRLPGGTTKPDPVDVVRDLLNAALGTEHYAQVYAACVAAYGTKAVTAAVAA